MKIVTVLDKRSGIEYAYESVAYWDKVKKQGRHRRKLVGKVDPQTGEIVPTDGRMRMDKKAAISDPVAVSRKFYGATYLLDVIGEKLGIVADLKRCFPETYLQILSIAYYLILQDKAPLYRFSNWDALHKHPYGRDIPSQRSSELFASITESAKEQFFLRQSARQAEDEHLVYDVTSISSYSEALRQAVYGYNRENDHLPQINLALIFGAKSNLPFHYRKLAGNIPDVSTLKEQMAILEDLGFPKVKLVLDNGFYSKKNVDGLYTDGYRFLILAATSLSYIGKALATADEDLRCIGNYNETYELHMTTIKSEWKHPRKNPGKGETVNEKGHLYIHCYYNPKIALEAGMKFKKRLLSLKRELETGKLKQTHRRQYAKWFHVETVEGERKVSFKKDAIAAATRHHGIFTLIGNEELDASTALQIYRNKDVIEKAFGNVKERLNFRRALVSSELGLEGKLFVVFIALIFLSHIKKQMEISGLVKKYSTPELLDELGRIECYERAGKEPHVGEVLKLQRNIYTLLGYPPPA